MADDKKAKPKDEKPQDAAEEGAPADAAAAKPADEGKSKKLKKIALIIVPLIILLAGVGFASHKGLFNKKVDCASLKEGDDGFIECEEASQAKEMEASQQPGGPGIFMAVPDMVVNLNSTSKQPRFLKVALKLELENGDAQKQLDSLLPRIIDQFQMYLRELRIEDLRGTSGIYRMKIELLSRVRAAAPDVKVRDVLFQEILVQ